MASIPEARAGDPGLLEALNSRGNVLRARGELAAAEDCYRRALAIAPNNGMLLTNLGTVVAAQGHGEEALACFRAATAALPDHALPHYNLGRALLDRGELDEALVHCGRAAQLDPTKVNAHLNLGNVYRALGDWAAAADCYRRALAMSPNQPTVLNNLGSVLVSQNQSKDALDCFRAAMAAAPDFAPVQHNLGALLLETGDLAGAERHCREAARLDPGNSDHHFQLGCIFDRQNDLRAAAQSYERAIALKPDHAQAHGNLGLLHIKTRQPLSARVSFNAAIAADSEFAAAHLGRAMVDLQLGDWDRGWPEYDWRWRMTDVPPPIPRSDLRFWRGQPLKGTSILLVDEQGLGDALQFIRYVPLVAACGGRVLLRVRAGLRRLFFTVPGVDAVSSFDDPLPAFATHCPLLSLPYALGTTLRTVPAAVPYLSAERQRVVAWRERLGARGFKIGICWHGGAKKTGLGRSFPLRELHRIATLPQVRLISLQKFAGTEELGTLPAGMSVETLGEDFDAGPDAFLDTAAVIENLDLVITCDTSIAHLAGALARRSWIALPYAPDWRWMLERHDSPWYPTHRLFRQTDEGSWSAVFEAMYGLLSADMGVTTGSANSNPSRRALPT